MNQQSQSAFIWAVADLLRAALEQLCASLGYEVLSIQLVMVDAHHIRISETHGSAGAQVLEFPVRRRSSMD